MFILHKARNIKLALKKMQNLLFYVFYKVALKHILVKHLQISIFEQQLVKLRQ